MTKGSGLVSGWLRTESQLGTSPLTARSELTGDTALQSATCDVRVRKTGADVAWDDTGAVILLGNPQLHESAPVSKDPVTPLAKRILLARSLHEVSAAWLRGRFALISLDTRRGTAVLGTDRFAAVPLSYCHQDDRLAFSDVAEDVPVAGGRTVSPSALVRYLYFHVVPAPTTAFAGVFKLRAAEQLRFKAGHPQVAPYWIPSFGETDQSFTERKREFLHLLEQAVRREAATTDAVGTYLSGGTDSSTVTGLLSRMSSSPIKSYSIGFEASGYDEMSYARIAARRFGVEHHEYYVTPDDVLNTIPELPRYFDQPFGNSSALPALLCARRAFENGTRRILAGDGGDELFGGNARYAKQQVFELYGCTPEFLRQGLIEPLLLRSPLAERLPLVRKARSYVLQANVPMPDRLQTYNLLQRIGVESVLQPAARAAVGLDQLRDEQRVLWDRTRGASLVNRMLAFDWQYTLADSDLPKVTSTSMAAGLQVAFPFLDDDLLDFSLTLPTDWKVRGQQLRYFFKKALADLLPVEIVRKQKHGFGLPYGVWLTKDRRLREQAEDALNGLSRRGILQPAFRRELESRLGEHAAYYGELVWVLSQLEHWLRHHDPRFSLA